MGPFRLQCLGAITVKPALGGQAASTHLRVNIIRRASGRMELCFAVNLPERHKTSKHCRVTSFLLPPQATLGVCLLLEVRAILHRDTSPTTADCLFLTRKGLGVYARDGSVNRLHVLTEATMRFGKDRLGLARFSPHRCRDLTITHVVRNSSILSLDDLQTLADAMATSVVMLFSHYILTQESYLERQALNLFQDALAANVFEFACGHAVARETTSGGRVSADTPFSPARDALATGLDAAHRQSLSPVVAVAPLGSRPTPPQRAADDPVQSVAATDVLGDITNGIRARRQRVDAPDCPPLPKPGSRKRRYRDQGGKRSPPWAQQDVRSLFLLHELLRLLCPQRATNWRAGVAFAVGLDLGDTVQFTRLPAEAEVERARTVSQLTDAELGSARRSLLGRAHGDESRLLHALQDLLKSASSSSRRGDLMRDSAALARRLIHTEQI